MNIQMTSTTQVQRNLKQVLAKLDTPVVVLRDSAPAAVMLSYAEYQRLANLEREILKRQMKDILNSMAEKNKNISETEVDADVAEARRRRASRRP